MKRNSLFLFAVAFGLLGCASAQSASNKSESANGREIASDSAVDRVARRYAEIADILSQVRNNPTAGEDVCTAEAYQGTIMEALQHVKNSGSQDVFLKRVSPAVRQALESVLGFKAMLADDGYNPSPDFLAKNLPGTHWEDVGHGAYGHGAELNFRDGNKVTVRYHRWMDDADSPTWLSYEGTWKITYHKRDTTKSRPHVVITYSGVKSKPRTIAYGIETSWENGFGFRLVTGGKKAEQNGDRQHIEFYDHITDECDA